MIGIFTISDTSATLAPSYSHLFLTAPVRSEAPAFCITNSTNIAVTIARCSFIGGLGVIWVDVGGGEEISYFPLAAEAPTLE